MNFTFKKNHMNQAYSNMKLSGNVNFTKILVYGKFT